MGFSLTGGESSGIGFLFTCALLFFYFQDQLASLETKISRMEHQAAQHQQYVTLEGIENSNARALVVKGINVLLTLLQVLNEK